MSNNRQIMCRMPNPSATVICCEDHIQYPVDLVLDPPMVADGIGDTFCPTGQARDILARLHAGDASDRSFRAHQRDRTQLWPACSRADAVKLVGAPVLTYFTPSVGF